MPRVLTKKANKPWPCEGCKDKIKPGESYYKWSFRYGGTHRQHVKHGQPKPSQLTQSKMSPAYAAIEAAEAAVIEATTADDIASALTTCASSIEEVRQDYESGLENLPDGLRDAGGPGGQTQEKIDNLQEFQDSLESEASDIEGETFEIDDVEEADNAEEEEAAWLQGLKDKATEALGNHSL